MRTPWDLISLASCASMDKSLLWVYPRSGFLDMAVATLAAFCLVYTDAFVEGHSIILLLFRRLGLRDML